jgi:ribosome-associated translation inhibitor RaiA
MTCKFCRSLKIKNMVKLIIKNIKELEDDIQDEIVKLCEEKHKFYENLFKKYSKNLTIEIIFNRTKNLFTIISSINLKSKKIILAEESKDIQNAVTTLFSKFKKAVVKQYELERKDYEYKRKR